LSEVIHSNTQTRSVILEMLPSEKIQFPLYSLSEHRRPFGMPAQASRGVVDDFPVDEALFDVSVVHENIGRVPCRTRRKSGTLDYFVLVVGTLYL
jgi:hypothetical protein